MQITEKEKNYLLDNRMFNNRLSSGGYITAKGYLKRENFNEFANLLRRSLNTGKNHCDRRV